MIFFKKKSSPRAALGPQLRLPVGGEPLDVDRPLLLQLLPLPPLLVEDVAPDQLRGRGGVGGGPFSPAKEGGQAAKTSGKRLFNNPLVPKRYICTSI